MFVTIEERFSGSRCRFGRANCVLNYRVRGKLGRLYPGRVAGELLLGAEFRSGDEVPFN